MNGPPSLGVRGVAGQRCPEPGCGDRLRYSLGLTRDPADDLVDATGRLRHGRAAGRAPAAVSELLLGGVVVDHDHPTGFADVESRSWGESPGLAGSDERR